MAGGGSLVEYTVTGNPATFTTDVARALTAFTIPFTPIQSGSGDPSPDNVRPITGITGLNVYRSGADTSNPTTYSVSFPAEAGTVYGGELDTVTGVLTVNWQLLDTTWGAGIAPSVRGDNTRKRFLLGSAIAQQTETDSSKQKCNIARYRRAFTDDIVHFYCSFGDKCAYVFLPNNTDDSTVIQVAVALATPVTYQLTPLVVETLKTGTNNIWTDTNGTNSITYLKKE